jgi:hypothetical protein
MTPPGVANAALLAELTSDPSPDAETASDTKRLANSPSRS